MLKDGVALYTELSGEDGSNTSIGVIGAYLDGYEKGKSEQQWITSPDKFPDVGHNILISTIYGHVGEGEYKGFNGYHHKWIQYRWNAIFWDDEVIAWMPLPTSYMGDKT